MADIKPLQPVHTPVASPEARHFLTSTRNAGFPSSPILYPSLHTKTQLFPASRTVGRVEQYKALGAQRTTYSVPVHTVNQKIQGPGKLGGAQGHRTVL